MSKLLLKVVEVLKALAYLSVTVSLGYGYLNKDALLSNVAEELHPYIDKQVEVSVKKYVPVAVEYALTLDEISLKIDSNQFRQFKLLLDENKAEILVASANTSEKISRMVLREYLVIEKKIEDPTNGRVIYLKGILIGKDELGRDDWIYIITTEKNI